MENKLKDEGHPSEEFEKLFAGYSRDFSDGFESKIMSRLNENPNLIRLDEIALWRVNFYRIIIPAAAIFILLLGIQFSLDLNISNDSLLGLSEIVDNQIELITLTSHGF